jgi:tetratricopeptide (TPR) repeat protein
MKNSEMAEKHFKKANELILKSQFNEAIELYSLVLDLNYKPIDALFLRGASYFELGMTEDACAEWKAIYDYGFNDSYEFMIEHCK